MLWVVDCFFQITWPPLVVSDYQINQVVSMMTSTQEIFNTLLFIKSPVLLRNLLTAYIFACLCMCKHHACISSCYLCIETFYFDCLHSHWIQLPHVEPQKPRDSANEPAHICLQTICNIFYSGVCSDSTTVFAGKSASTCVREQARACARHLISVPVKWCVSCAEKRIKTIWKYTKVVSACHVGLKLHVGQDDWLKHGICILLWQLIWTFVLFVSETICTVKKHCKNRKLEARYVSPRRSAYKNRVTNRRVQGLRHNKL